jgi:hypothetical protein
MLSDFFFPSELHDTLTFAHFKSCFPQHLRAPRGVTYIYLYIYYMYIYNTSRCYVCVWVGWCGCVYSEVIYIYIYIYIMYIL